MVMRQATQLEPMLDEESTDADEPGAFASLLSEPSWECDSSEVVEAKLHEEEVLPPPLPSEDSEQASDAEKSIMVCRHWRSKGWCRLEENCKFLHPEHKRGIT